MNEQQKRKQIAKISVFITSIFVIFMSVTYAFITQTLTGTKEVVINAGVLDLVLEEENAITISDALPMYDEVGMIQEPFTFRLVNNGNNPANYKLKLVDVTPQTVEFKCSDLGEITLNSPAGCRETIYPEELRQEALTYCQMAGQEMGISITTESDCASLFSNVGAPYTTFEEFIEEGIAVGVFKDTRTLIETYPDNIVELPAMELYGGNIRYGLTRNSENTIGSINDMEYTWKIYDFELRETALEQCKTRYPSVTDEASCLETVNDDWGTNYKTFDDFIGDNFNFNGGKSFILDAGKIGANETINYDLRLWIDEYIEDITWIEGMTFSFKIDVEVEQEVAKLTLIDRLKILKNVQESTSTFPNFKWVSSATNGRGIYKYQEDGEDIYYWRGNIDAVATEENRIGNHVIFGGFCWEMVRTTKTGGVKMIYDGKPVEVDGVKTCPNTGTASQLASKSSFNPSGKSPAYVGYMYGNTVYKFKTKSISDVALTTAGILYGNDVEWTGTEYELKAKDGGSLFSSTGSWSKDQTSVVNGNHYTCFNTEGRCEIVSYVYNDGYVGDLFYIDLSRGITIEKALEQMYSNEKDSTIKTVIETWFESTDLDEEENLSKLEDAVYCNDRSVTNTNNGWSKDGDASEDMFYSSMTRRESGTPDLSCSGGLNNRDRFTYKDTVNGNGLLKWPVGLLSTDEIMLAGGQSGGINSSNSDCYLYTGETYWSLSPNTIGYYFPDPYVFVMYMSGSLAGYDVYNSNGVRPVVSLASDTTFDDRGTGTVNNPYVVE